MLVGRTGLAPEMVGRAFELEQLERAFAGEGPARPTVALLAGEAGIGKTRLVQELVARVPADTVRLAGQADSDAVIRPLGLFLDAVDHAATQAHSDLLAKAADAGLSSEERVRAAVDLVHALTEERRGLVVLEDLHWADAESLQVFERLAEPRSGISQGRLLLVGTYRPDGLSRRHPAAELVPRLERRHSVTHLHLTRLSPAEVGRLLMSVYGEPPTYRVVEALHSRTGGNPFFLEELIASAGDQLKSVDPDELPLPWTVGEVVRGNFDELDPDVRRIVAAAAVLGRRVTFDTLAIVTKTSEDELISHLRTAVDSGLLVEVEPDVFGFHHELAREAIEASLLGRERRRLHEAALDAFTAAGDHAHAALARHARGAARYDEMIEHAKLGANEALALGSSYQALQLAECGLSEAEDDMDLLAVAARAAWLADQLDDAVAYSERWLRLARTARNVGEEAAALSLRMRVAYDAGDLEGMRTFVQGLVDVVDQLTSDEERAQVMATIAQYYMLRDKPGPAIEWADKARDLAEQLDLTSVLLAAMVEKGSVLLHEPERIAEGYELLQEAVDEAERVGEHLLAARALNNLIWHAREWSEANDIRQLLERMRVQSEAAGFDMLANMSYTAGLAEHEAAEGNLAAAIEVLDDCRHSNPVHQSWREGRWQVILRAGLALEADDLDTAAELTEVSKPATEKTAVAVFGLDFNIACRRGDIPGARRALGELLAAIRQEGYARPQQVHDLLAAGLSAGLTAEELQPLVDEVGLHYGHRVDADHPWRRLIEAQLAEVRGDHATAFELYLDATDRLGSTTDVLGGHRGSVHVGAARCLIVLGRLDEARVHVEAAAGYLARWSGWRVRELEAVQRRLGLGPQPSGPDALTPREREVAALLAEGLTNSQLAERLFISPRTAAVHVSNILAKLGMSSRTEVAAWAAREAASEAST